MSELKVPGGNVLLTGRNYGMKHRKQWNKSEGDLAFYRGSSRNGCGIDRIFDRRIKFSEENLQRHARSLSDREIFLSFGGDQR
jgi:hypothetical protein